MNALDTPVIARMTELMDKHNYTAEQAFAAVHKEYVQALAANEVKQ